MAQIVGDGWLGNYVAILVLASRAPHDERSIPVQQNVILLQPLESTIYILS